MPTCQDRDELRGGFNPRGSFLVRTILPHATLELDTRCCPWLPHATLELDTRCCPWLSTRIVTPKLKHGRWPATCNLLPVLPMYFDSR